MKYALLLKFLLPLEILLASQRALQAASGRPELSKLPSAPSSKAAISRRAGGRGEKISFDTKPAVAELFAEEAADEY